MGTQMGHTLSRPDINLTDDFVQSIFEKQFPELTPVKINCIAEGWDNKIFFVNDQFIFKFPHRKTAALIIEQEHTVLSHLQGLVGLKIPNPIYTGKSTDDYPYNFYGYQMIKGESVCNTDLSVTTRNLSVTKLAEFLKRLHSMDETKARTMGAVDSVFDRTDINKVMKYLMKGVEKINTRNIPSINLTVLNEEMKTVASVQLPKAKVLVHGDLYCRHLMFDHNDLVGIIDWGHVGINHPAVDLGVVFSFYPTDCHQAFFDIYGNIDSQTHVYARFLGLYSAIIVMLYGYDIGDAQLVQEAKDSILRINRKLLV